MHINRHDLQKYDVEIKLLTAEEYDSISSKYAKWKNILLRTTKLCDKTVKKTENDNQKKIPLD